MNKKQLSERDICTKYITPALEQAGWDVTTQVREEFPLTRGRVIVWGKLHTRARHKRADYVLFYKPNIPNMLAITNGINVPSHIRHDNTLGRPLKEYGQSDRVDLIITNPPFGGMEEDGIENNFPRKNQTREVWFFEHPYPEGYKSYSRSKPLTIAEFELEKGWWGGAERRGRKGTEQAWKVTVSELVERNYNLDCKNPHEVKVNHRDPEELMAEYQQIVHQLEAAQQALKAELMACLGGKA